LYRRGGLGFVCQFEFGLFGCLDLVWSSNIVENQTSLVIELGRPRLLSLTGGPKDVLHHLSWDLIFGWPFLFLPSYVSGIGGSKGISFGIRSVGRGLRRKKLDSPLGSQRLLFPDTGKFRCSKLIGVLINCQATSNEGFLIRHPSALLFVACPGIEPAEFSFFRN